MIPNVSWRCGDVLFDVLCFSLIVPIRFVSILRSEGFEDVDSARSGEGEGLREVTVSVLFLLNTLTPRPSNVFFLESNVYWTKSDA